MITSGGWVWYGMVWYGMVWYGMVWYGLLIYIINIHKYLVVDHHQVDFDDFEVFCWLLTQLFSILCIQGIEDFKYDSE